MTKTLYEPLIVEQFEKLSKRENNFGGVSCMGGRGVCIPCCRTYKGVYGETFSKIKEAGQFESDDEVFEHLCELATRITNDGI